MYNKRMVGKEYEKKAVKYLQEKGYYIIDQNFYSRGGEVDIIAKDKEYLVFIEVKYRTDMSQGYPEEAVYQSKRKKIVKTAKYYMLKNNISTSQAIRFDVISVLGEELRHIEDAFWIS